MQTSHGAHSLRNHDREEAILHETRLNRTGAFLLKLKHFSSYEILLKSPTYKARQELLYLRVKLQRRPAQLLLRSCPRETLNASEEKTGNHSHPEMIWGARNIPQPALLKLMILYT